MRDKQERRKLAVYLRRLSIINPRLLSTERLSAAFLSLAIGLGLLLTTAIGVLIGYGWLYLLRHVGLLSAGPRVADSLPLLQLAGFDGQPLAALVLAWLLGGAVTGLLNLRLTPSRRALAVGLIALVLLLVASEGSYAVARNLRFGEILLTHAPGPGPWLEALVFTIGCALPRRLGRSPRGGRRAFPGPGALGHLGLSRGELGHAAQHDGDGDHVGDDRDGVRTQ